MATLRDLNKELKCIIRDEKESPLSRTVALNLALKLKESAGEIHFQHAMHETEPSEAIKLFQRLNEGDKDHAGRIRSDMNKNGIEITCN